MDFYFVKPTYVQYLKTIDSRVPDVQYAKRNKFLCGVVFDVNGKQYFSPVSSFNKQQRTNFIIEDKNGKAVGSLRLSFMLPIPREQLSHYVISQEPDPKYRTLLTQELDYIQKHEPKIKQKAAEVYAIGNNPNHYLAKNCCDFARLEREATAEGYQRFLEERQAGVEAESVPTAAPAAAATEAAPEGTPAAAGRQSSPELLAMVSGMQDPVVPGAGNVPQASKGKENINE